LLGQEIITCGTTRLGTFVPTLLYNHTADFVNGEPSPARIGRHAAFRSPSKDHSPSPAVLQSHHLQFSEPAERRLLPLSQRFHINLLLLL